MNFYFSKLDLAGMWGGRKKTHFRFSLWRKNVCAMAQKCVLDSPSGYEKKFFFLVVYILVLCLKGIFAAFVLLCIQAFGSLWVFYFRKPWLCLSVIFGISLPHLCISRVKGFGHIPELILFPAQLSGSVSGAPAGESSQLPSHLNQSQQKWE